MRNEQKIMCRIRHLTQLLVVATVFALPLSTTATDLLFPLAGILSIFSEHPREKWLRIKQNPVPLSMLAFFLLYLIGTTYTIAPAHDITHQLIKGSSFLFAALLIPTLLDERWRRYAVNAFLFAMTLTLFLSYTKYFFIHDLFHTRFDYSSVFKDHIIQNFLMAFATFIFAYRWIHKYRFRWVYGFLTLAATFNVLFMSLGRTGYFIFAALLIFTFVHYFRWKGILYALTTIILLFGLASLTNGFRDRMAIAANNIQQYSKGHGHNSLGIRIQSMKNAATLYKEKPLIGYGTGSYKTAYATLPAEKIKTTGIMVNSYNAYLNTAVELGIPGIVLLLTIFFMQWRYSFELSEEWRYLTQILLISMMLGCFANPWLQDTTELHLYVIFMAISFAALPLNYLTKKQSEDNSEAVTSE